MLRVKKINNSIVHPVPIPELSKEEMKPIKGADLFSEIYCNTFILAKKKSGKSSVLYKVVKETTDPRTKVYAFVSTLNKDKIWHTIRKYCETKSMEFNGFTSIIDDNTGVNIVQQLVTTLQNEFPVDPKAKKIKKESIILMNDSEDDEEKPKRYKYCDRPPYGPGITHTSRRALGC